MLQEQQETIAEAYGNKKMKLEARGFELQGCSAALELLS
jgi:hypothetical protein